MSRLLTPHFAKWEFTLSQTATRNGIPNDPLPEEWEALYMLAHNILEPCRKQFGPIRITSGYRSRLLNSRIGGSLDSQHSRGEAADIVPLAEEADLLNVFAWLRWNTPFDQLIWEFGRWIHVSHSFLGPQRGVALIAQRTLDGRITYARMYDDQIEALVNGVA